jgi:hypothetical protein
MREIISIVLRAISDSEAEITKTLCAEEILYRIKWNNLEWIEYNTLLVCWPKRPRLSRNVKVFFYVDENIRVEYKTFKFLTPRDLKRIVDLLEKRI